MAPLGGMEQMMIALLGKMGIDPEMVKGVALNVQNTTNEVGAAMQRIEAKLDRMEIVQDRILFCVEEEPAGGFVLGDGSPEDIAFRASSEDAAKPYPENVPVESSIPATSVLTVVPAVVHESETQHE